MAFASWLFVLQLAVPDVADDRCLMNAFVQLLERGEGVVGRLEAAAFLVREGDGSWTMIPWPRNEFSRRETFRGVIPQGTVAIAHTHPPQMERPSRRDLAEATRLGLPIYVVSFWAIWVADPSGKTIQIVQRSRWSRSSARDECTSVRTGLRLR